MGDAQNADFDLNKRMRSSSSFIGAGAISISPRVIGSIRLSEIRFHFVSNVHKIGFSSLLLSPFRGGITVQAFGKPRRISIDPMRNVWGGNVAVIR